MVYEGIRYMVKGIGFKKEDAHVGLIVQKYYDNLIMIGRDGKIGTTGFFIMRQPNILVKLLKPGDKICL